MNQSRQEISKADLQAECERLGVELMGVVELVNEQGELANWYEIHQKRFTAWLEQGAHAEMDWMETQAAQRCDPRLLLPNVRTGIALWIGHHFKSPFTTKKPAANIARYAWGRDYHNVLRRVLRQLNKWLNTQVQGLSFHGSVDTSPVLERAIAERSGLGWIGKSTMLIHPQRGTYGSIAIALSSAVFTESKPALVKHHCGTCQSCFEICPTGALSEEGLDARKCISYWTIEHRGLIPKVFRSAIGNWVFGCDLCQEVCPWSIKAEKRMPPALEALWQPQSDRSNPNLYEWLQLSDEALNMKLQGSPLRRAFPHGLKRNALIVLHNQKDQSALPLMLTQFTHHHEAVRATAVWAVSSLLNTLKPVLLEREHIIMREQILEQLKRLEACETSKVVLNELAEAKVMLELT